MNEPSALHPQEHLQRQLPPAHCAVQRLYLPHHQSPTTMASPQPSTCNLRLLLNSGLPMVPTTHTPASPFGRSSHRQPRPQDRPHGRAKPSPSRDHHRTHYRTRPTSERPPSRSAVEIVTSSNIGERTKLPQRCRPRVLLQIANHTRMGITSRWMWWGRMALKVLGGAS